jgi:hypothetical protein
MREKFENRLPGPTIYVFELLRLGIVRECPANYGRERRRQRGAMPCYPSILFCHLLVSVPRIGQEILKEQTLLLQPSNVFQSSAFRYFGNP